MEKKVLDKIIRESVSLAEKWQNRANELLTPSEKKFQKRMMRLLNHPTDKVTLTRMIDQSFRTRKTGRVSDQVVSILKETGIPQFFSPIEKLLTNIFIYIGRWLPFISIPIFIRLIRAETRKVILAGESTPLHSHLKERRTHGVRMNLNHLGEAVLGEEEALHHFNDYLNDLKDPDVEYISVKISTIYSQINSLAFEETLSVLKDRLSELYRTAENHSFKRSDGTVVKKFVNLDMEEYKDLEITAEAFIRTLDQEEFKSHSAGIVLQAYLPDSFNLQKKLTSWAKERIENGGSPIKIRIVKGANMEMEKIDAIHNNWPLAPYDNKLEVDANFKRMVNYGMTPENIQAVKLGIASHNLFELAFAKKVAEYRKVESHYTFEMLEGMADHVRRAIQESTGKMLLYAPVALKEQFINAIAYLIRRLDENTAKENFLRYAAGIRTHDPEWDFLRKQFEASCYFMDIAGDKPNRIQDRSIEKAGEKKGTFHLNSFVNEPDTDWAVPAIRKWAASIREKWMHAASRGALEIPVVAYGEEVFGDRKKRECYDASRYNENVHIANCALANENDILKAVETARTDPDGWRNLSQNERYEILSKVSDELRLSRGDLMGSACLNTGKVFRESDPEISEAIDFVEYYPYSLKNQYMKENLELRPRGVGVVISPWNFPIAIPCGGIAASLAAGNTVIFKPASSAILPAFILCECFWRAGVSKKVLQFLPFRGDAEGRALTGHPEIDFIIFTGGTDTGLSILKNRPDVYFAGETGGKNSTIVTSMADRDQAIKNIIHSAFSNCGQKCSATSLLILEDELYKDDQFRKQLVDAARSYRTGSAWDFKNSMGPLISPPGGELKRALTTLEPGEEWALKPINMDNNPYMWTPGIKWGVRPSSYTHLTEFFGPVLAVMRADNLDQAISFANQTGYGLTAGLESLDKREQDVWKKGIQAGNLYVNKGTTGAIVLRQPFGGMGKSALGAGKKAGGPNYTLQFMDIQETFFPLTSALKKNHQLQQVALDLRNKMNWGNFSALKADLEKTVYAIKSYLHAMEMEFSVEKDYFKLRGQDNITRYLPIGKMGIRIHEDDSLFDILGRVAAAKISGCQCYISIPFNLKSEAIRFLDTKDGIRLVGDIPKKIQSDKEVCGELLRLEGLRYAAPDRVPESVFKAAADIGFYISREKVLMDGMVELLQYYREQSICDTYHRYGNIGDRAVLFDF